MHLKNKIFLGVLSSALVSGVYLLEGTRYVPYDDVVGVVTVCQGYTGKDIDRNKRYTDKECRAFTEKELRIHQAGILQCINVPVTQYQLDAFTLFAYNMGVSAFCTSGIARELNKGNYTVACNRLTTHPDGKPAWSFADGKYVQGLQNRRQYEKKMCLGELNVTNQVRPADYRSSSLYW